MALDKAQKRFLRGLTHHLNPVVMVAERGLAASVMKEIEGALAHHELIKVRVSAEDRAARDALMQRIARDTGSEIVHRIGHVVSLFRRNPEAPKIELP
ncbi:MAG: ribosome assembly RNA-binding protein YhbY [Xanthomonadales bacterium]|nr:RNA-binding protein [Xanthomonadales bacterium]MCC6593567.1 ribosome assembly RNA-binding protein YhbY [Xanthomonadales bacterium]MCE7932083.1 ribosome assembly RNA-binding protein YhbY [Xanthomonadales bacterium PRO6]